MIWVSHNDLTATEPWKWWFSGFSTSLMGAILDTEFLEGNLQGPTMSLLHIPVDIFHFGS